MRRLLLGLFVGLVAATVAVLVGWFGARPAHISQLVPEDFRFGVFSSSLNDLHELYEAPFRNQEADPARLRFGNPVNVPGLNGFDYEAPLASFLDAAGPEIFLIPVRNAAAFEDAHETAREQISIRRPRRPASNYLSLSVDRVSAKRGEENALVVRAAAYPLAVAGHPADGLELRQMLTYLLARESPRKPPGVPLLLNDVAGLPDALANAIARECDDLLLGFPLITQGGEMVRAEGEAALRKGGPVARAAPLAAGLDLSGLAASFPYTTVLLVGGVLDGPGWREMGLPLPVGDAAVAAALVKSPQVAHARPFTLLLAARPARPEDLAALEAEGYRHLLGEGGAGAAFHELPDGDAVVRTAEIAAPPPWLAQALRSQAKVAPPLFVSTAVEQGVWYCAVGSQAEWAVRLALDCLRGKPELSLRRSKPVSDHAGLLARPHAGLAIVTVPGVDALGATMPMFEVASLGQPPSITAFLEVEGGRAKLDVRIAR